MKLDLSAPILYLITRGETAEATTAESPAFLKILNQVSAAVAAGIDLIQIREKKLSGRVMFELTARAVERAAGTSTRILVNDRADIAAGAGAAGVHLTTDSIDAGTIRKSFGKDFLIGASTHSLEEAHAARNGDADFAVFGPVFETSSKSEYGPPLGLDALTDAAQKLAPFPLLALGGVSIENADECLSAGASGIAGISLFADPVKLKSVADSIRRRHA
jgi:thiamine-phosphate pyrophosphorylase